MDSYNRGSHSVYKLTYHIIFVTKYRKKVITDEIGDFRTNHAAYLCGLGTFGLSRGIITKPGMAGRFGSIMKTLIKRFPAPAT